MLNAKYILNDQGDPEPADLMTWAEWYETADRHVVETFIPTGLGDEIRVSTVFIGLDMSFFSGGPPVLWETMVFGGNCDGRIWRYASEEAAEDGHRRIVASIFETAGISP